MNERKPSGSIGIIGIVQIVFIILKLTNLIAWSWVWVLSPLWITAVVLLTLGIVGTLILMAFGRKE